MALHKEAHTLANQTIHVHPVKEYENLVEGAEFQVEDYWDRVYGSSWMNAKGNPACLIYALRTGLSEAILPTDDEVLYGKIGGLGYLVHLEEIGEEVTA